MEKGWHSHLSTTWRLHRYKYQANEGLRQDIWLFDLAHSDQWDDSKVGFGAKRMNSPLDTRAILMCIAFLTNSHCDSNHPLDPSPFISLRVSIKLLNCGPKTMMHALEWLSLLAAIMMRKCQIFTIRLIRAWWIVMVAASGSFLWIDYGFQALWMYEIATYSPFFTLIIKKISPWLRRVSKHHYSPTTFFNMLNRGKRAKCGGR